MTLRLEQRDPPDLESESQRPSKRPREKSPVQETIVHAGGDLYLENGDVVLLAPIQLNEPEKLMAFRVDKVILSRYSVVFRDMWQLPSPDCRDMYDGVPYVRLHDESLHVTSLVNEIYRRGSIPLLEYDRTLYSQITPLLQISTKYQIESIRSEIVRQLERDWPTSLVDWDRRDSLLGYHRKRHTDGIDYRGWDKDTPYRETIPEPASVVSLARDCEVPTILPTVFYHLSRIPYFMTDGYGGDDYDDETRSRYLDKRGHEADFSLLSMADLHRLLTGRERMAASLSRFVKRITPDKFDYDYYQATCCFPSRCRRRIVEFGSRLRLAAIDNTDPLQALADHSALLLSQEDDTDTYPDYETDSDPGGLPCWQCSQALREDIENMRMEFWDDLPLFFSLSPKGRRSETDSDDGTLTLPFEEHHSKFSSKINWI